MVGLEPGATNPIEYFSGFGEEGGQAGAGNFPRL